jgi:cytochrome c
MSSLELNKVAGAVLLAALVALVSGILAQNLVKPRTVEHAAIALPEGAPESAPAGEPEQPLPVLLAAADAAAGESVAKRCASCHTFDKGGAAKVGPNLWGVVGAPHGHMEGFAYSDAIKGIEGNWDYEGLNHFLTSPKDYAPGTKMTFAGLKKAEDRANLLAYLQSLSDSPVPFPEPSAEDQAAAAAPEAEAPAEAPAAEAPAGEAAAEAAPTGEAGGTQAAAAPEGGGIAALLASADTANGEKISKRCAACHSFDNGGANKIGPNLWNVVGDHQGQGRDYQFSEAMAGLGGSWTYQTLDEFLTSPKAYVPGTKMTFAGLKKAEDRADLIAWLRTLSESPQPLP